MAGTGCPGYPRAGGRLPGTGIERVVYVQVNINLLKPNLHLAVCNLLLQEMAFGPAALCSEWFMERCDGILT